MSSPLSIYGSNFYRSNGTQFFIKGVVYASQPTNRALFDVLSFPEQCAEDIPYMVKLGVNTVHIYNVDAKRDHDRCMSMLAQSGIYVFIRIEPYLKRISKSEPEWTIELFQAYTEVLDLFSKYDNVAGFFVGAELVDRYDTQLPIVYLKAAIADLKKYRNSKGYRRVPIGTVVQSEANGLREKLQEYLTCADNSGASNGTLDFMGLNHYGWCGNSSFVRSGLADLLAETQDYTLPVFLAETGCNNVSRYFTDQPTIFGSQMNERFSGAIIYEWGNYENQYGLVEYEKTGTTTFSRPFPKFDEYSTLMSQWATLNPTGTPASAYTPTTRIPNCPVFDRGVSSVWSIGYEFALPTLALNLVSTPNTYTFPTGTFPGVSAVSESITRTVSSGTSTSNPSNQDSNDSSNIGTEANVVSSKSTGTTIGIGVGIGVAGLLVIAFLVLFLRRRKNKRRNEETRGLASGSGLEVAGPDTYPFKPELDTYAAPFMVTEKSDDAIDTELGGLGFVGNSSDNPHQSSTRRSELPSDSIAEKEVTTPESKSIAKEETTLKGGTTPKEQISPSSTTASNNPWHDAGRDEFSPRISQMDTEIHAGGNNSASTLALAQAQSSNFHSDPEEVERLEEEERRLDREIAESERLRKLQLERERVRRLLEEKRRAAGGGG